MPIQIVIRPLSGSSPRQLGPFSFEHATELVIGRDPGAGLLFDSAEDLTVSRRHAVLKIIPGGSPRFRIADLNSRHGTIVNDRMISSEQDIRPGDAIQLGSDGPRFAFELYPPAPARSRRRTATETSPPEVVRMPPFIEDLEAFAMAAAASGTPWQDQVFSGHAVAPEAAGVGSRRLQLLVWALVLLGLGGTAIAVLLSYAGT